MVLFPPHQDLRRWTLSSWLCWWGKWRTKSRASGPGLTHTRESGYCTCNLPALLSISHVPDTGTCFIVSELFEAMRLEFQEQATVWTDPVSVWHLTLNHQRFSGFFFQILIHLFLTALGLRCCSRAFSSCSERGRPSSCSVRASHRSGVSCSRAQALGHRLSSPRLTCSCEILPD